MKALTRFKTLKLTPALRKELKKPLGMLVRGSPEVCMKKLKSLTARGCTKLITVGDVVTAYVAKAGMQPDLQIVDHRAMRESVNFSLPQAQQNFHLQNPPGMLVEEVWGLIKSAIEADLRTCIIVEGEEDLLTLPAVVLAPENSLVIYGQPREGLVVVKVTQKAKSICWQIINKMEELLVTQSDLRTI